MTTPQHLLIKTLSSLFLALTLTTPSFATYTEAWEIDNFHAQIEISEDGIITITETIDANFTNEAHRGLERFIPFLYQNDRHTRFKFLKADPKWNTTVDNNLGYAYIRMLTHDNSQIQQPATYQYTYQLKDAISRFPSHDEFYWNVNGTEWVVPTNKVTTNITFPQNIIAQELHTVCYTGPSGSREKNCQTSTNDNNQLTIETTTPLEAYQGLTIAIKLPQDLIASPTLLQRTLWFLQDNIIFSIPLLVFLFMLHLYFKKGRDEPTTKKTVIPHYKPPKNLKPTEVGTIIDERLDARDITATIIDLAIRKVLIIEEINNGKDHKFILKQPYTSDLPFEQTILNALFPKNQANETTNVTQLKNQFYKNLKKIDQQVMDKLIQDNYFPHSPTKVRAFYFTTGGFIASGGFYIFSASIKLGLMISLTGLIIIAFANFMPRKTQKGAETYYQLKGLYEYINTAEKDRLKFQEDHNIIFEKLLPYAMAFGLIHKWTSAFSGLIQQPPSWYHGTNLNINRFARNITAFSINTTNNIRTRPGSSSSGAWSGRSGFGGGGFSGGGFGGGGGRGL